MGVILPEVYRLFSTIALFFLVDNEKRIVMVKRWFIGFLLGTVPLVSIGQNVLIDAEIRPRTEMRDGFKTLNVQGKDPGVFTSQRTRLGLTYASGLLNAQVTFQDARVYGQYGVSSTDASIGLFEGWAELLLVPGGTLKIGRQTLKYDDNRLFSSPTWSNAGTTHDLALIKFNLNDWQLHLGMAYNNSSEISSETLYANTVKYRSMAFAWFSKDLFSGVTVSGILADEGIQDTVGVGIAYKQLKMNHAYTFGGNLKYHTPDNKLCVLGTAYFQAGTNSKGKDMDGRLTAIKVDYSWNKSVAFNLGADFFSGDGKPTDGKQTNFKKLYGSDHTFNGVMDYWDAPLDQGLLDYYGGVTSKLGKRIGLDATYHLFQTDYALSTGGKDLGSEVDLILNYKLNAQTTIQSGWCCYLKTENTLVAKKITAGTKVTFPQWAYVMLTIKPTFFTSASIVK